MIFSVYFRKERTRKKIRCINNIKNARLQKKNTQNRRWGTKFGREKSKLKTERAPF